MAQQTAPPPEGVVGPQVHPILSPLENWILASPGWSSVIIAGVILLLGEILHRGVRRYVLRFLHHLARHSPTDWDNAFFESGVPRRLARGVPLIVWYYGILLVPFVPTSVTSLVQRGLLAAMVVVLVRSFDATLEAIQRIYSSLPQAKARPIKGFLQVANVVAYLAGLILIVSVIMGESPWIFLSGLGAMTAVLLLVFRDTLLSLVAGIQITTNDLLRVGDWIEMPQFDADGDVVDIALNSVRVQNWDRTFAVIPTHKFLEHSFRNWRGMQESGGRRIKRAFHLDQTTIRFLTPEEVEDFGQWEILHDYIHRMKEELSEYNREHRAGDGIRVPNVRRMTNVGTLRAYIFEYLKRHPGVHQGMTLLVRQLPPGPEGLPIEIYVFASDIQWANYEALQADLFDHILATIPEFGLKIFQQPSGADVQAVVHATRAGASEATGGNGSTDESAEDGGVRGRVGRVDAAADPPADTGSRSR